MNEQEWETFLFQFLCTFIDSEVKRFDLMNHEHRQALANAIAEKEKENEEKN